MLATIHTVLLLAADDSDDGGLGFLGLLLLLAGPGFYLYVFLRYRNVDKRHRHETETKATKLNLRSTDEKIRSLTGLTNATMSGANNTAVTGAGGLPTSMGQLKGLTGQLGSLISKAQQSSGTTPTGTVASPPTDQTAAPAGPPPSDPPTAPPPTAPPSSPPPTAPPPPAPPPSSPPPGGTPPPSGSSF